MYNTSEEYKTKVYAPERQTKARVTFDFSDVTALSDVTTINTPAQFALSNKLQLIDRNREINKFATFEPNRFRLDGSFSFADINNLGEVGYCSNELCDTDGYFTNNQVIEFVLSNNQHSSAGLTLTFDILNNEHAVDFIVDVYNGNTLVKTVTVADNTDVQPIILGPFDNYSKVVVTINKWNKGQRRCRVSELDFGFFRIYTDNSLIKLNYIEDLDLTSSQMASSELKFTFDNSNKEFNILNPNGFYKYLQERQKLIAEIGVVIDGVVEYIPLPEMLLREWQSDEGSLTTTFTARWIIDKMSGYFYENLTAKSNYTLYDLAVAIFQISGIDDYVIDSILQSISTSALVEKTDCKTVLQMIAIAGCCVVYVSRDNKIVLKPVSMQNTAVDNIDLDNMYKVPQISLDEIVKSVEVSYYTNLDTSTVVMFNNSIATDGKILSVNNTLINTLDRAAAVANWILSQKSLRAIYSANWRGNPAQELVDTIAVESGYNITKKTLLTKTELEYAGYLRGKTELRGDANGLG